MAHPRLGRGFSDQSSGRFSCKAEKPVFGESGQRFLYVTINIYRYRGTTCERCRRLSLIKAQGKDEEQLGTATAKALELT